MGLDHRHRQADCTPTNSRKMGRVSCSGKRQRQSVSGWRGRGVAPRLHHLHQGLEAGGVGVEAEPRQSVLLVAESRVRRAELRHLTAHTCDKKRGKATPTAAGQGDRGVGSEGSEKIRNTCVIYWQKHGGSAMPCRRFKRFAGSEREVCKSRERRSKPTVRSSKPRGEVEWKR